MDGGTTLMEMELDVLRKKNALELRDVAANVMTAQAAAELSAATEFPIMRADLNEVLLFHGAEPALEVRALLVQGPQRV